MLPVWLSVLSLHDGYAIYAREYISLLSLPAMTKHSRQPSGHHISIGRCFMKRKTILDQMQDAEKRLLRIQKRTPIIMKRAAKEKAKLEAKRAEKKHPAEEQANLKNIINK